MGLKQRGETIHTRMECETDTWLGEGESDEGWLLQNACINMTEPSTVPHGYVIEL